MTNDGDLFPKHDGPNGVIESPFTPYDWGPSTGQENSQNNSVPSSPSFSSPFPPARRSSSLAIWLRDAFNTWRRHNATFDLERGEGGGYVLQELVVPQLPTLRVENSSRNFVELKLKPTPDASGSYHLEAQCVITFNDKSVLYSLPNHF